MWEKDYKILRSHQDIWRRDLGIICLLVDCEKGGKYFFQVFGGNVFVKSKTVFDSATEAQAAAEYTAKNKLTQALEKLKEE